MHGCSACQTRLPAIKQLWRFRGGGEPTKLLLRPPAGLNAALAFASPTRAGGIRNAQLQKIFPLRRADLISVRPTIVGLR